MLSLPNLPDVLSKAASALLTVIVVSILTCVHAYGQQTATDELPNVDPAYASWFRYDNSILDNWRPVADKSDPLRLKVYAGGGPATSGLRIEPRFRVMVLYPRPSSAYDVAITRILNVFSDRDIKIHAIIDIVGLSLPQVPGKP